MFDRFGLPVENDPPRLRMPARVEEFEAANGSVYRRVWGVHDQPVDSKQFSFDFHSRVKHV